MVVLVVVAVVVVVVPGVAVEVGGWRWSLAVALVVRCGVSGDKSTPLTKP
jgi:hypothetical protein